MNEVHKKSIMKFLIALLAVLTPVNVLLQPASASPVALSIANVTKQLGDIRLKTLNNTETQLPLPPPRLVWKRSDKYLLIGLLIDITTTPRTAETATTRNFTNSGVDKYLHRDAENSTDSKVSNYSFAANIEEATTKEPYFRYVRKSEWDARLPQETLPLHTPVKYVVIHHSYFIKACYTRRKCAEAMRDIQDYHMDYRGWWDIGYNFGVGSDGVAYEGRGWSTLGSHAMHLNNASLGICMIGDWTVSTPPLKQLRTMQALIRRGIQLGYINKDYKLIGHRQTRSGTKCPGAALYRTIKHLSDWEELEEIKSDGTALEED